MNIAEYKIEKFPAVIFSDSHTNLSNIKKLKELYPDSPFFCLGDITFLFAKPGEEYNKHSIQYFIDNKIPCLEGNHESFIVAAEVGDGFTLERIRGKVSEFDLPKEHINYLKSLPRGFKLLFPYERNFYCFHNEPKNLWNFPDKIDKKYFKDNYIFDEGTIGVLQGHLHMNHIDNFDPKRIVIGQLSNSKHHDSDNSGGNYLLLTEHGVEFKKV